MRLTGRFTIGRFFFRKISTVFLIWICGSANAQLSLTGHIEAQSLGVTGTVAAGTFSGPLSVTALNSITSVGTITIGNWNASLITGQYGGTGVNNSGKIITLGANLTTAGAFNITLNATALTNITLPASGTLATLTGTETLTNKTISGASNTLTNIATSSLTGNLQAAQFPALTGDVTTSAGNLATTLATVNSNVGVFGSSTAIPSLTLNAKGLVTAATTNAVIAPAGTLSGGTLAPNVLASSLTSLGTLTNLNVSSTAVIGTVSATNYNNVKALQNITQLAGSGTYNVPSGVYSIEVILQGGGGGGGGTTSSNTSGIQAASGGGAGAYEVAHISVTPGQSFSYGVGAAGAANSGAAGGTGGTTTFSTFSAPGGSGGAVMAVGTSVLQSTGGSGATASGSDLNVSGGAGENGMRWSTSMGWSGKGANSQLGFGGSSVLATNASVIGVNGSGFGSGGSGAFFNRSSGTPAARAGGSGGAGTIIIKEYR